ncbi:MAG: radical SAM protein, partial [Pseudomonadales bacterium]|nr:radical SAM protein [Pseudomonadales bacterium]
ELGIWVRLHYVYPYPHVDKVIRLMAEGKILPYLDIPFQHASYDILRAMKRPAATENTLARIAQWRAACPELTIRSTFIVGFPGETDAHFNELLDFLDAAQLDRVGCFKYSPVAGASANALPNPVDESVKEERWARFMEKQQAISAARLQQKIGSEQTVLVDGIDTERDCLVARSQADAPEIDGLVYVEADGEFSPGDLIDVRITNADDYDLYAAMVDR